MHSEFLFEPYFRLVFAVIIGGLIGLDRAFRGRAAGFRTHILVCLSSCLLMIMTYFQWETIPLHYQEMVRMDPARMAQGVMTGIGFLGAGAMMQDKQTIRGLTTAASIWITASIGLVIGAGFYGAALIAALLTLVTLSIFNRLINLLPLRHYAILIVRFSRMNYWSEVKIRSLLNEHSMDVSNFSFKLTEHVLSYQMTIRTSNLDEYSAVVNRFMASNEIEEFSLKPMGD
jgi:putative Mg2+ transporter-C (MgtC) family protein